MDGLADHQHRDALAAFIAGDPLGSGIVHGRSIDQKLVQVTAMAQADRQLPGTVHMLLERMAGGIPLIEIAYQKNLLGRGSETQEIDRFDRGLGLKASGSGSRATI